MPFGNSWIAAIKRAVAGWDPSKHPRGRDGKFLEVGDKVKIFEGPGSPQKDSGTVVAGHLYEDGRFFVAVKSDTTGKLDWYRPKQLEAMHPKADLTPKVPIPDIGNKDATSVPWQNEDLSAVKTGADTMVQEVDDSAAPAVAKKVLAYQNSAQAQLAKEAVGKTLGKEGVNYPQWLSPHITDKPPAMDPIVTSGDAWAALYQHLEYDHEPSADMGGFPADPGFGFAKNGVDVVVYDPHAAEQTIAGAIDLQNEYGSEDYANSMKPVLAKVQEAVAAMPQAPNPAADEEAAKILAEVDTGTPDPTGGLELLGQPVPSAPEVKIPDSALGITKLGELPPPAPGDKWFYHPQGKKIVVHPDGSYAVYSKDNKPMPLSATSATAEKLLAGYGLWKEGPHPDGEVPAPGAYPGEHVDELGNDIHINTSPDWLQIGKPVVINNGPFEGHKGTIEQLDLAYGTANVKTDSGTINVGTGALEPDKSAASANVPDWAKVGASVHINKGLWQGSNGVLTSVDPSTGMAGIHVEGGAQHTTKIEYLEPNATPAAGPTGKEVHVVSGPWKDSIGIITGPFGDDTSMVKITNPGGASVSIPIAHGDLELLDQAIDEPPIYSVGQTVVMNNTGDTATVKSVHAGTGGDLTLQFDDGSEGVFPTSLVSPDPNAPAATPAAPAVTAPAPIKLPAGQTPGMALNLIYASAKNKGLDTDTLIKINDSIGAARANPNLDQAQKHLATAMTLAKLGGKQRARYKQLLAMHHGVEPAKPQSAPSTPVGSGAILPGPPKGGVVPTFQQAAAWVKGTGSASGAKANIQQALSDRLVDVPAKDWADILWGSPGFSGGDYTFLKQAYEGAKFATYKSPVLYKSPTGEWTVKESSTPGGTKMPITPDNIKKAMRETAVRALIANWAGSSNDNNVRSLVLQEAAQAEFGLPDAWIYKWHSAPTGMGLHRAKHMATYRKFLRAMYDNTQAELKKKGWTHVRLRRGVTSPPSLKNPSGGTTVLTGVGKQGAIIQRPMSSFSPAQSTASGFGSYVQDAYVPIERIIGSALTGFGCLAETEFVVLGGPNVVTVQTG